MRTTLTIDDDVLQAAKELGKSAGKTAGQMLSELARKALTATQAEPADEQEEFYGFRPFPKRGRRLVTNEMINKLREDDVY